MALDFECFQLNIWQSVGIVLYEIKEGVGNIIRSVHISCDRGGLENMSRNMRRFWMKHLKAYEINYNNGHCKSASFSS